MSQYLENSTVNLFYIVPQHHPAKPAVEDHQHWSKNRRRAIAQKHLAKTMQHTHQRHAYYEILDEQGIAQTRAGTHKDC